MNARAQAMVWFAEEVLQTISTTFLKDPTRTNPVGFVDRAYSGTMVIRITRPRGIALNRPFRTCFTRHERLVIDDFSRHQSPNRVPTFPGWCDCAVYLLAGEASAL